MSGLSIKHSSFEELSKPLRSGVNGTDHLLCLAKQPTASEICGLFDIDSIERGGRQKLSTAVVRFHKRR